ncbi:MAG: polysaccharide biosynthesis C-terminal domain-containing protein, partial [Gemmataceae bacterium]
MYAVLIPRYGSMGAAIATLIGFVFLAVCTWAVSQRVFPVRYEWPRLAALLALAVSLWLISRLLPAAWWVGPVKAGLWLLGPLLAWHSGLMSQHEKKQVRCLSDAAARSLDSLLWSRTLRAPLSAADPSSDFRPLQRE